jgi:hypothetical protein
MCNSATSARGAAVDSGNNKIVAAKVARAKPAYLLTHWLQKVANRADILKCPDGCDNALNGGLADALLRIGPHLALDLRSGQPIIGGAARRIAALDDLRAIVELELDHCLYVRQAFVRLQVDQAGSGVA